MSYIYPFLSMFGEEFIKFVKANPNMTYSIIFGGLFVTWFKDHIFNGLRNTDICIKYYVDKVLERGWSEMVINRTSNYDLFETILRKIVNDEKHVNRELCNVIADGNSSDDITKMIYEYRLLPGDYIIVHEGKRIMVEYHKEEDEEKLVLKCFGSTHNLEAFIGATYQVNIDDHDRILWFKLDKEMNFGHPDIINLSYVKNITKTSEMTEFINDVKKFKSQEEKERYFNNGYPYRKGYLLQGETGTGKSASLRIVAREYGMHVYEMDIDAGGMDTRSFKTALGKIPPNSIIFIDEFEKKLKTCLAYTKPHVDESGVLSGFDGGQSISEGSIIILNATSLEEIKDNAFLDQLTRPGRIDKTFTYVSKLG